MPFSTRLRRIFPLLKTKLVTLNLFRTRATNDRTLRKQLYTTRVYLAALVIVSPILLSYILLNQKAVTVTVRWRSLNEFDTLRHKYSSTISCPCADISISYERFIDLHPYYHQICSSDFVSQAWFEYLYDEKNMHEKNYRATASAQFQILSSLCEQAQEAVSNSLIQFLSTKLTSAQLISSDLLETQVNTTVNLFIQALPQSF